MKARSAASEVERTTKEVMNGTSKKALQNGSGKKPKINLEAERKRGMLHLICTSVRLYPISVFANIFHVLQVSRSSSDGC
jgi:hypothetical protein